MSNSFEDAARKEKALRLSRWLYRCFLKTVADMDDANWENTAAHAEVKVPSAETRKLVIELLKGRNPV